MRTRKTHEEASPPRAFEPALQGTDRDTYVLRLHVSGMTPNSLRAIENIRRICAEHLAGRYHLEIIDIYQQPILAGKDQVVVTPTLVKERPPPLCKIIGDLSQTEQILQRLDVGKKS